jgi:acetylornithine deacetylase
MSIPAVAARLAELVQFDTRNPGGDERAICEHLGRALREAGAEEATVTSVADKHAYVYARFGRPRVLVNVHVDTVPAAPGWSRPPLQPVIEGDHLFGLGAADTKGAIAAVLTALERVCPRDLGILFSGDEEHRGQCMRAFTASPAARGLERAIVSEPTSLRAGMRHRGILAFRALAHSAGGHSSRADELERPIAELARLAVTLDDWGRDKLSQGPAGFPGMCLNVAELRGGVAFNVVPPSAELIWSVRPPPGASVESVRAEIAALIPAATPWDMTLGNPSFATRDPASFRPLLGAVVEAPIDLGYWTEAAVLAQAGIDAVVFGPGDIAVAHAADEHVPLAELETAVEIFEGMFRGSL